MVSSRFDVALLLKAELFQKLKVLGAAEGDCFGMGCKSGPLMPVRVRVTRNTGLPQCSLLEFLGCFPEGRLFAAIA